MKTSSSSAPPFAKDSNPMDKFIRQIFSARGRSIRTEWWLTQLIVVGVFLVIFSAVFASGFSSTMLLVAAPFWLLGTVIVLLVSIRRLHDRDMSGHWLWLFYLAPNIFGGLGEALEDQGETGMIFALAIVICSLISIGITIWGVVVMGFLSGTSGPNRYGPDPLQST